MVHEDWLNQVVEPALEPALPIVDAHHHLWPTAPNELWFTFTPQQLTDEIVKCGHNIVATVCVDSHSGYRTDGPEHMRVVGETESTDRVAADGRKKGGKAATICAAIVSHANLLLGSAVGEVLDAHMAASKRFRGIRHMTAFEPGIPPVLGCDQAGVMMRPDFRAGLKELVKRGLSFDAWLLQPQLPEFLDLARAFPDAALILDHVGGPLAEGRYIGRVADAFEQWKEDMTKIARCPNVTLKLGALNMSQTGMDAVGKLRPHTSEEVARLQREHILTSIDLFGPSRCMFESNFPVDKMSVSYTVVWNSFKRVSAGYSAEERSQLFSETARRVYRIEN
jgi:L-fuconolactonase